jgi:hypothetical protein
MLKQQQFLSLSPALSADTVAALRRQIHGCEACCEQAILPFTELVMRLIGRLENRSDQLISEQVSCPSCESPLDTDTLVKIQFGIGQAAGVQGTFPA